MAIDTATVEARLHELQQTFVAGLPGRLDDIEEHWRRFQQEPAAGVLAELHRCVHSLTGSGQTFGCAQISDRARLLEHELQDLIQRQAPPGRDLSDHVSGLVAALRETVAEVDAVSVSVPSAALPDIRHTERSDLVYIFEDDAALASELSVQLGYFGYQLQVFRRIEDIELAVAAKTPAIFIIDIVNHLGPLYGIEVAARMRELCAGDVPLVFLSARGDFEARLEAVRAGGNAYVVKPVDMPALVGRLDELTHRQTKDPLRILIADDDVQLAAHYGLILRRAGMTVTVVTRPEDVMDKLLESDAELIMVDLYMPGCSGHELARVIRQQDAFVSIPIVFLSTETDHDSQLLAMRTGGNDFLTKPIADHALIAAIELRAQRARVLGELMMYDSLTGLLNHARIREALGVELARAARRNTDLSYVMIDIDNFKNINDTYGHMMGDRVIKSLARLLRQRLRQGDSVGRYGGEEFALILSDCDQARAFRIVDEIRNSFSGIAFAQENRKFSATFSAGLASFPAHHRAGEICQAADEALYRAKNLGRNRVEPDADGAA